MDSHDNMTVVGDNATFINQTGKCADTRPFSKDLSRVESVFIVDAAVACDCPYSLRTYILLARNMLYVPSMRHNLIHQFLVGWQA